MTSLFGWLTPKHLWVPAKHFDHIPVAISHWDAEHPEFARALKCLTGVKLKVQEAQADLTSSQYTAQEVEMRRMRFKDFRDWYHDRVYWQLLRCGFLRVGTEQRSLHFEGSPQGLQHGFACCNTMAERHGLRPRFEPQKEPVDKTKFFDIISKETPITPGAPHDV